MKILNKVLVCLIYITIPATSFSMSFEDNKHLWSRTGFGNIDTYGKSIMGKTRDQAIDVIINLPQSKVKVIKFDEQDYLMQKNRTKEGRRQFRKKVMARDRKRLSRWWHRQIILTENPLEEKMTIFWHRHFTSDLKKVSPPIMHGQNILFRTHALSNYAELLKATMKNPAIHLYLDNQKNTAKKPNENLARELLELYTMGEGNGYTEQDIKEIARSITGYRAKRSFSQMSLVKRRHDAGRKTIFGKSGWYGMDGVIDLILQQPQVATYITTKILQDFLTETPSPQQVEYYSTVFRQSGYEIKPLLTAIFRSEFFWKNKNNLVKSPYDMFKSAFSLLPMDAISDKKIIKAISKSGQKLFYPPDVKGWRTGQSWLSSDLVLERMKMLNIISKPLKGVDLSAKAINYAIGYPGIAVRNNKWLIRRVLKNDNFNFK